MKKKMIAALLTAAMAVGSVSGVTVFAADAGTDEKAEMADASDVDGTTITFWHSMGGVNGEAIDTLVKKFNDENEYGITVDAQYQGEYDDSLNKLKSAQIGNMGADLVQVYEIGSRFMIDSGWIVPMQQMIDADSYDVSEIEPNLAAYYTIDNELYSMPFNSSTPIMYYNKDMLKEAGIDLPSTDAASPWSWDEFVENAKKITKDSSGNGPDDEGFDPDSISVYGTMMPTDWVKFIALLHTNGVGILNEDGDALGISTPEGIEVIQAIADLGNTIHCAPSSAMAKGAFSDASAMLMNGQVAMVIDGGWALANYTNEGFDVGVAPIPAFQQAADISWTAGLCMSPNAAENEAAFDFYQYFTNFTNSVDAALNQGVSLGGLPQTLEVFDGGENEQKWISTYSKVDATEMCEAFKNILQADTTVLGDNVRVKNFPVIVDNTIVPALDNVWLGETTAEEALTSLNLSDSIDGYWK